MIGDEAMNNSIYRTEPVVTFNEAVAMMLGWMPNKQGRRYIGRMEEVRWEYKLPFQVNPEISCLDLLRDRHKRAIRAHSRLVATNAEPEVIREDHYAITCWEREMILADVYESAIRRDLDKAADWELEIDHRATESANNLCLLQSSLDRWAQKTFNHPVFHRPEFASLKDPKSAQTGIEPTGEEGAPSTGVNTRAGIRKKIIVVKKIEKDALLITDANSTELKDEPAPTELEADALEGRNVKKGMTRTSVDSLYLTLAFLIDLFVEEKQKEKVLKEARGHSEKKFWTNDGQIVVKDLAQYLEEVVAKANGGALFHGQGWESMKTRIEEAHKVKRRSFSSK